MIGYDNGEVMRSLASNNASSGINFFTHNGSAWGERLRIHTNGNVGINQSNPDSLLHMVNADSGTYRFGYSGTSDVYIDSDNFYWRTDNGGSNQMSLISGNLLMGHTSSMTSGGNTPRLQVSNNNNDAAIGVYNYGNNAAHFASLRYIIHTISR